MQTYDKSETLKEDIMPLLEEIRRICNQHTIQFVVCFQYEATEEGEQCYIGGYYIDDEDFPASIRLNLMDKMAKSPPPLLETFAHRMGLLK